MALREGNATVLDNIRRFLTGIGEEEKTTDAFDREDPRVAAAALMYHVIQADGVLRPIEQEMLRSLLKDEYALDSDALEALIEAAREADSEAVDLYRFTSILMRKLSREQCIGLVELLWELVYADRHRHELEDNVVWRISELLGVSGRERILMRQRVQYRMGIVDGDGA